MAAVDTPQAAVQPAAPPASRSGAGSRLFILAVLVSAGAHMFTCMGGEMQMEGLPLSIPGAVLAWVAFACYRRPRRFALTLAATCGILFFAGNISAEEPPTTETRPFWMGFNPWPYDATTEAVDWTYKAINAKGDVISHHIEEGVPWPEAAAEKPFADDFATSLDMRLKKTEPGKKVFLSLNPINPGRNGLAPYRGSGINMALPSPWDKAELNSKEVKSAYLKYLKRMIALFKPDWLAIGIEVNLLARNSPALWPKYVELHRYIYGELKKSNPGLVLIASFDSNALLDGYSTMDDPAVQKKAFQDLLPFIDTLGISLHPFLSTVYFADSIPEDMFDRIFTLTKKPVAITESSYSAQPWTLHVNGGAIEFKGSPEKQVAFTSRMLEAARKYKAPFVVMFTIRDYDALWNVIGKSDLALPWRDTGLYDEDGKPRPALETWEAWLKRPRK